MRRLKFWLLLLTPAVLFAFFIAMFVDAAANQHSRSIRKHVEPLEARIRVCEQTVSRLVDDVAQLDNQIGANDPRFTKAAADRDVAFLLLEDLRIAVEAIGATQKGRFRAPFMPRRKRP